MHFSTALTFLTVLDFSTSRSPSHFFVNILNYLLSNSFKRWEAFHILMERFSSWWSIFCNANRAHTTPANWINFCHRIVPSEKTRLKICRVVCIHFLKIKYLVLNMNSPLMCSKLYINEWRATPWWINISTGSERFDANHCELQS